MKTIYCKGCKTNKEVPDNYSYNQCPKCRERYQKHRKKEKIKKQKQKEEEIEAQIAMGNINYGLEAGIPPFMTYEEFSKMWNSDGKLSKKEVFEMYLKEKREYEAIKTEEIKKIPHYDKRVYDVPFLSEKCRYFRMMHLGLCKVDAIFIQNHIACKACTFWLNWHPEARLSKCVRGVNLWK